MSSISQHARVNIAISTRYSNSKSCPGKTTPSNFLQQHVRQHFHWPPGSLLFRFPHSPGKLAGIQRDYVPRNCRIRRKRRRLDGPARVGGDGSGAEVHGTLPAPQRTLSLFGNLVTKPATRTCSVNEFAGKLSSSARLRVVSLVVSSVTRFEMCRVIHVTCTP